MRVSPEVARLNASFDGRYAIERELGVGGMATVYLARDEKHDRQVALKVLRAELAEALGAERFLREIRIAARLEHPHILALFDSGAADGLLYYVMPYVDGGSLRDRMAREGPLPLRDVLRIGAQVADALAHAHGLGVVHRDIKPENILLSGGHAKVADFGIALATGPSDSRLTQVGLAMGAPAYMSPEQIVGEADLDGRSDLYSLGCVLFEMLAGSAPFAGANAQALMAQRFMHDAPRVASVCASVPPMIDLLLARALARDPAERHASIGEFGAALLQELTGPSVVTIAPSTSAVAWNGGAQLIGRERELMDSQRLLARLAEGKGGLLLIGGEPGIGKTRLSTAIMEAARKQRALCVTGHCYEMEGTLPFAPFAEILDSVARLVPLPTFREVLGDAASEIARIQPSLRQTFPDIPAPFELAPDQQRRYLFNKYREYVERSCRVAPIAVLLDDLHWADDASLSLLEHIAGYAASLPLLIVGTYRDVEAEMTPRFAHLLEALTRQRLATRMILRPLDETRVADLLAALGGSEPPPALVRVVFAETEGNPFFVEEVFQHLREEGRLFDADGEWRTDLTVETLDVPEGVRLVIGRRLERLTPACRAVLTSAAVIGHRFELVVLEALAEHREDELFDALDEAARAQLIVAQRGGREVVYAFAHALIRQTLLSTVSLPRRQRRHQRTAAAMEAAYGARASQRAAERAFHLYQAGSAADPDQTVRLLTLAAQQAVVGSAFAEALAQCERAATIADVTNAALVGHVLRVRGAALKGLGRWPEAVDTLAKALNPLRRGGDATVAARVALDLAWLMAWAADNQGVHDACAAALALLPDAPSAERVRLLTLDAWAVGYLTAGGYEAGIQGFADAREMARALGDESLVGFTYHSEAVFQFNHGRMHATVSADDEAIPRLGAPADVQWRIEASAHRVLALTWSGRFADADAVIDDVRRVAQELGNAGSVFQAALAIAGAYVQRTGDLPGFEALSDEIANGMPALGPYGLVAVPAAVVSQAERGDLEGAFARATLARQTFPASNQWSGLFAGCELWCLAKLDHPDWHQRIAEYAHVLPVAGEAHFIGRRWFAVYAVLAHVARGDLEAAAALYGVLRQTLDDGLRVGPLQPVEGLVGLAAAAGGNWDLGEQHFRSALAFADDCEDTTGKPSVQKWYAWMLLRRGAPGDRELARRLLGEASTAFRALGMLASLGDCEKLSAALDG